MVEEHINYHGKYLLTLVFASILFVTLSISTNQVFAAGSNSSTSTGNYTFLNDTFDNDLSGWQYYGNPGYQVSLNSTTGQPAPSAQISGDISASSSCEKGGMYKIVDISSYTTGALTLGFNWRASSSGPDTTEAAVSVDDADTGTQLFFYQLANNGSPDTGWQYYSTNISNYISADKKLQVNLYLNDCWSENWNENNWYDNISLVWNTAPAPPNAPTGLNATAISSSQINLSWNAPVNNGGSPVTGYKIERSTDFGSTWSTIVANTNSNATSYSDTGVSSGTWYTYRVSAINAIGTGTSSNVASSNPSNASTGGRTIEFSSSGSFTGTVNASDTLIIDQNVTVTSNGITNHGQIRILGTLAMNGSQTTLLNNYGLTLLNGSGQITGESVNNYNGGNLIAANGQIGFFGSEHLNNYGYFMTKGGLLARDSGGTSIINYQTGVIDAYGSGQLYQASMTNYGTINAFGSIELDWGGIYTNGTYNNHSTIDYFPVQGGDGVVNSVGGTFNNFVGAGVSIPSRTGGYSYSFYNSGTVNNNGTFDSHNYITNSGVFNNNGTVTLDSVQSPSFGQAILTNSGMFYNMVHGSISNGGTFNNACSAIYDNQGTETGYLVIYECRPAPKNLLATGGNSQALLSWTAPPSNSTYQVTNYEVYRGTYPGIYTTGTKIGNVTSYNYTGLTNGQPYYFWVTAANSTGQSPLSNQASATPSSPPTAPSAPQNLMATPGSSQVSLSWQAPSSNGGSAITGYNVYRGTIGGGENTTSIGNTSSTVLTYTDTTVINSQTYYYTVKAVNSAGTSSASNEASATPTATTNSITLNNIQKTSGTLSSSPYQLTLANFNAGTESNQLLVVGVSANNNVVTSVTFGGVSLSKKVSSFSNNDAEFWYLKNPSGTGNIVVTMSGSTSVVVGTYSFSGVNETNPIPTSVTKHNTASSSPTISLTTQYQNDWVLDLPSIYGGVTLGSPTCTQQWDANIAGAITGASSSAIVQSPGSATCSWTASGGGDLWDDVAVEIKASGTGSGSTTTVPSSPTGLAATAGNSHVSLSWTASSSNGGSAITGYNIYRGTTSGGEGTTPVGTVSGSTLSYTDTGLTNGQTYFYKVTAVNSVGQSTSSNEASATPVAPTVPKNPTGLVATAISSSQINLGWTAPASNGGSQITGYEVERSNGDLSFGSFSNSTSDTFFSAPNATAFADTALASSTTYNYTVFAKNSVGSSQPSNTASATTSATAPPPTGITLDNVQKTSGTVSSSPYQLTLANFNAGTGSNNLLVVGISANNAAVTSVTFGGTKLTQKISSFNNNDAEFWYLKNPTGTGNIVVTMGGSTSAVVGAYSFSGIDQTAPIPTSATNHNTAAGSPAISITTQYPNSWVLDLPAIYGGVTLGSPTCTQEWDINVPSAITGASSSAVKTSAGSTTCSWTASNGGDLWDDAAIEIKASG